MFVWKKEWRSRDDEFIKPLKTKNTIIESRETGSCCLFKQWKLLKKMIWENKFLLEIWGKLFKLH